MTEALNIKELERRAWKSYHQDGLKDIFVAVILVGIGLSRLLELDLLIIGIEVLAVAGLIYCKRHVVTARLGFVQFGAERRATKKKAVLIVGSSALVVLGVYLTLASADGVSDWLAGHGPFVHAGAGLWIFLLIALMAYWLDFTRMYWIALVTGTGFSSMLWLGDPTVFIIAGLIVLIPGVILLIRFLHRYPVPAEHGPEEGH